MMGRNDNQWQRAENPAFMGVGLLKDTYSIPLAITHLKNYLEIPRSVSQALTVLKQLDYSSPLYRLYRWYSPREWACSVAGTRACNEEGYAPREREFLRLVERHLFPLDCDYMVDMAAEGARMERMLLFPYATRWYEDPQEMAEKWQLLLIVSDSIPLDEALLLLFKMEKFLEPSLCRAIERLLFDEQSYSLACLKQICAELTGPLAHLALTFSSMFYDTGNEWLDVHGDDGTAPFDYLPLRWCEQHIDLLSQTFREAQDMEQRSQMLADWLEADLNHHIQSILDLLEQAQTPPKPALS